MKVDGVTVRNNLDKLLNYKGVIYYGVPSETTGKRPQKNLEEGKAQPYNNAQILQIMEYGSPINNIPKRELLAPVIEKNSEQISKALSQIVEAIIDGDEEKADLLMQKLALRVENWCKKFFTDPDNNWAPNAPITINGGWMRNKVSGKPVYIKGKGSDRPLIDTGSLRQSIKAFFSKEQ